MKKKGLYKGKIINFKDLPKEQQEYIGAVAKFEREHNTFLDEKDINCDYVHCVAGMGVAGNGKCFNKGNGKPDCPQFINEKEWLSLDKTPK